MPSLFFPKKRSLEKKKKQTPSPPRITSPTPTVAELLVTSRFLTVAVAGGAPRPRPFPCMYCACVVRWVGSLVGWLGFTKIPWRFPPWMVEIGHWQPSPSPQQKTNAQHQILAVRSVRVKTFPHLHHHAIYHYLPCIDSIQGPCRSSQFWPRDLLT